MIDSVAAVVGPTATGKSALAVQLARTLSAEIVSFDSMQIYRGMDAGTDKPTPEMRAGVPHHLVDVYDPSYEVTVAEFQQRARAAIADITRRGRLPLLVGGSGLYFRAVVDDLRFPPRAAGVRSALEEEAEETGVRALYERLQAHDSVAAARIEPVNLRRIVRALEVIELTGRPFSDNDAWDRYESIYRLAVAGLTRPRAELYDRIASRVDRMLEDGLIAEARRLPELGRSARQALGYRQVLDRPDASRAEIRAEVVRATKRFARRQESWFKADPRVVWFRASDPDVEQSLLRFFAARLQRAVP